MVKRTAEIPLINREISWLSFNDRVLQEALDSSVPLIERFRFLGIFSNNLDEFFKVRVASVKRMIALSPKAKSKLEYDPEKLLKSIQDEAILLQKKFDQAAEAVLKEAAELGVYLVNESKLTKTHQQEVVSYFRKVVQPVLIPIMVDEKGTFPHLKDGSIYLAVEMYNDKGTKHQYALIEIPSKVVGRFLVLEQSKNKQRVILLDDIIRYNLRDIFSIFDFDHIASYTIKITRDAELDIDEDISRGVVDLLSQSLKSRKSADPVRFVYDSNISKRLLKFLLKKMNIKESHNLIAGGRYHNYKDFIRFPSFQNRQLEYPPLKVLPHPLLPINRKFLNQIKRQDILLNYPYQSFNYIIDLLREAAIDPFVTEIKINIYRLADKSKIANALISAAQNGKKVTAVIELRARFDEVNNIRWSDVLQEGGVKVVVGVAGLKVHSKLLLITRKERKKKVLYAHVGTGNFHEGTAKFYADTSLLTADPRITIEVEKVFSFLKNNYKVKRYSSLIISPSGTRRKYVQLIQQEIRNRKKGLPAEILIKLNNLVDPEMIKKLYDASCAGVRVKLIIRGICCLVPGLPGVSENISVISIVGRYLEHSRILVFNNNNDPRVYISSADWMKRNLDKRVEVSVPIFNKDLKKILIDYIEMQLLDNRKARIISSESNNEYVKNSSPKFDSQIKLHNYFKKQLQ